jgi:hypothetical protein
MRRRSAQLHLGVTVLIGSLALSAFAIPRWVSTPSNVPNMVLSPLFWPYILSGALVLTGIGLLVPHRPISGRDADTTGAGGGSAGLAGSAWARLSAMAATMAGTIFLLPRFGMVPTSMIAFLAVAFLGRTSHPKTAVACAILLPLALYAFFAHVAGVAIPQGQFIRLP